MNTKHIPLLAAALFASAALSHEARAVTVIADGTILRNPDTSSITVDYLAFTTSAAGTVTIDLLSWEWNEATERRVDVNGDGEYAFLDTYIHLFQGSLATGNHIASNEDSGSGTADGSVSALDSFLSLNLAAGNYILAISAYNFDVDEAVSGINRGSSYPVTVDEFGILATIDHGDYRVTLTGEFITAVPEPATAISLSALLGGGMLIRSRPRKK